MKTRLILRPGPFLGCSWLLATEERDVQSGSARRYLLHMRIPPLVPGPG
jgi:hypothetical protein